MLRIAVASENLTKVNAIKAAFESRFPEKSIETDYMKCESSVPRQPLNEEVYNGALNRLSFLKDNCTKNTSYDFMVACEGGLIRLFGKYYNLQIIIIEDKHGKQSSGFSQGFMVPTEYAIEALNTSIAEVMDVHFGGKGGVRSITGGLLTRFDLVKSATLMALGGFLW